MEEHVSISSLTYPLINFAILVAAMVYYLRKPIKGFVADRHSSLKNQLDEVRTKLSQAQRQYNEYSQRLSSMDAEVTMLVQSIRGEAESARVRVITEAKRMADQIVIDAKRTGDSLANEFKDQVRTELANQVIVRAETLLKSRMTGDVREQLRKDFSKQVESVSVGAAR